MARGQMVVGISLAVALALTGCAGKTRMTSSSMGQAEGGIYDIGTDYCEIGS